MVRISEAGVHSTASAQALAYTSHDLDQEGRMLGPAIPPFFPIIHAQPRQLKISSEHKLQRQMSRHFKDN